VILWWNPLTRHLANDEWINSWPHASAPSLMAASKVCAGGETKLDGLCTSRSYASGIFVMLEGKSCTDCFKILRECAVFFTT